jgi:peptidyl-tRNA hydrolase
MGCGKCSTQAGHAFLGAYLQADSARQQSYHADGIGTKICLRASSEEALLKAYAKAQAHGLPCVLIEDTGRNTCFNGVPTLTAVGIGPILSSEAPFLKRLSLCT